jgi:hypothetical protein
MPAPEASPPPTPLGVSPPIVRQWSRCVWVVVRWQTTGTDNFTDHNRVIAAVVNTVGSALQPGQRAVYQWCSAKWAWSMRNVVELAQQVSAAIGKVPRERLLINSQQRQAPVLGVDGSAVETARLADANQHHWRLQGHRAHSRCRHCVLNPMMQRCRDGHSGGEVTHDVAERIGRTRHTSCPVGPTLSFRGRLRVRRRLRPARARHER